ncbi:hypothetical protein DXB77_12250 [Clostridium sp. OM05-9]|nr:hypothetical protein DWY07_06835 [Clostridium sp. AF23-6LB]RGG76585.1 hypothetical protein DWW85_10340 [Clostridium sp. AF17-21AC]RHP90474.1 hypothetical protein DXA07_11670 [Clostridium sp. AM54-37XD]RHP93965.1 hypothetical protein DXA00_11695 [Clostridium sp. AM54-14XD]RHR56556.1 hypothetical protein DWW82_10470 [Clostridium sp. AF17-2]RHS51015.1 hypothetical protein DW959_13255 [Clostridium sp. AM46-21]RHV09350.1 hypothetical protein DXB77_12250 [Clostridium sp. OM05-9]
MNPSSVRCRQIPVCIIPFLADRYCLLHIDMKRNTKTMVYLCHWFVYKINIDTSQHEYVKKQMGIK